MALSLYHTTYLSLANDIISLVDDYKAKRIDEEGLQDYIRAWIEKGPVQPPLDGTKNSCKIKFLYKF